MSRTKHWLDGAAETVQAEEETTSANTLRSDGSDLGPRWEHSPERAEARKKGLITSLAVGALSLTCFGLLTLTPARPDNSLTPLDATLLISLLVLVLAAIVIPIILSARAHAQFLQRHARAQVDHALRQVQEDMALPDLLRLNRRQTQEYQLIAQQQALASHRSSQVASAIGLLVLISGSVAAILISGPDTRVAVAALTSLGVILSGYISRTYLRTYELTINQMNWYYGQPLISSYLLHAERLADKVSADRDSVLHDIITAALTSTGSTSLIAAEPSRSHRPRRPALMKRSPGQSQAELPREETPR